MTYRERYEKIADDFLKKMTIEQESHICDVIDNNNYIESIRILSKEYNIPYNAFSKVYGKIRKTGKTRNKRTNRWSKAEDDTIKQMIESGHSILEIASSLKKHPDSMRKKIIRMFGCVPVVNIEGEVWEKVDDSNYEISNFGRLRRIGRRRLIEGSISEGYIQVSIHGVTQRVHRLVAQAFILNPEGKEMVDHIDGNRTNNHVSNLRWVTAEENSNNIHRLKLLSEQAEKRKTDKLINDSLKTIFDTGLSKLDLIRRILDYNEVSNKD